MKKWLSEYGCAGFMFLVNLAILGLIVFAVINGNKQKKIKAQAEREQFVKDSIAEATRQQLSQLYYDSIVAVRSTKEYKDSVDAEQIKEQDVIDRNTMVILAREDSLYHYTTQCSRLDTNSPLQFMTQKKAKQSGRSMCPVCIHREEVYWNYEDGKYMFREDVYFDEEHYDEDED